MAEVRVYGRVDDGSGTGGDDGNLSLALGVGLGAALVGGLIWAAIAVFANLEIGWAAWGVGALVGVAMGRATTRRSRGLGGAAAALAALGLILGKVFILFGSLGPLAEELVAEDDVLQGVVAWQLYESRDLDQATLAELDATIEAGDTLSDSVWERMRQQAAVRLDGMTPSERDDAARLAAGVTIASLGLVGGVTAQLTLFDVLWFGLALATAFRMLANPSEPPVQEV